MKYRINPEKLTAAFTLPCEVADRHLKLAGAVQLKVLLYIFRNIATPPDAEVIAGALGVPAADVNDAMRYWWDAGLLLPVNEEKPAEVTPAAAPAPAKKAVATAPCKPDRNEVTRRGLECPELGFLLTEAQGIFGRALRQSESSTLVWLYDDYGMNVSVLLMLLQYAVTEGRGNIGFVEKMALDWINGGINDLKSAEAQLALLARRKTAWATVCRAFMMEYRAPSKKEQDAAYKWVEEWHYDSDVLKAAYDACVDATSKFSLPYINKIITEWHNKDIKTANDLKELSKPEVKDNSFGTYDLSLAEKLLDS